MAKTGSPHMLIASVTFSIDYVTQHGTAAERSHRLAIKHFGTSAIVLVQRFLRVGGIGATL